MEKHKKDIIFIILTFICGMITVAVLAVAVMSVEAETEEEGYVAKKIERTERQRAASMSVKIQRQTAEPTATPTETPKPTPKPTAKPKKKKHKKQKKQRVSDTDIYRLAQVISAENGSAKDDDCLVLTGIVVMKRVKSKSFPNTITGVVSAKWQYSTYPALLYEKPSSRCLEIAEEILRENLQKDYPNKLVFQSEFSQGRAVYRKIGHEYFCLAK